MIKIGITGSISSGKTTASKIISNKKRPLFSADKTVKDLYKNNNFKKLIVKKSIKKKIFKNKVNIKKLEKIIHPIVRKKMRKFSFKNKKKRIIFFEIPLLIESKLMSYFDVIIFIKAKRKLRLKRFNAKGGDEKLFNIMNKRQLLDKKKIKFCDHVVVNEKNFNILKKNLLDIIDLYV